MSAGDPAVTTGLSSPQRLAWLLGRDRRMQPIIASTLIASIPYWAGVALLFYGAAFGLIAREFLAPLVLGIAGTPLGLYVALRSGWTQRFADPSITLAQVLIAVSWNALLYALVGQARVAELTLMMMTLAIGVLHMEARAARMAGLYAVATMTVSMAIMTRLNPAIFVPKVEFFNWVIVASGVPTVALMGVQLRKLRRRLHSDRAELSRALERVEVLATHDELTGLHNRLYMEDMLRFYGSPAARMGKPFGLALLDLDHFKAINDRHGHTVGDQCLQGFARLVQSMLRESDVVVRWGGEEFLVLCPNTCAADAQVWLDRLRAALTTLVVSEDVPDLRVRLSAGVTEHVCGEPIDAALARADDALYDAKAAGRDRSVVRLRSGASAQRITSDH